MLKYTELIDIVVYIIWYNHQIQLIDMYQPYMFLLILDRPQGPHTLFETCMADEHRKLFVFHCCNK